jgi:hypothetical protein
LGNQKVSRTQHNQRYHQKKQVQENCENFLVLDRNRRPNFSTLLFIVWKGSKLNKAAKLRKSTVLWLVGINLLSTPIGSIMNKLAIQMRTINL